MTDRTTIILSVLFSLAFATSAEARSSRVNEVPHGNDYGCETCHLDTGGLNDFGFDSFLYLENPGGPVDWSKLAELDSDGDGYSNGLELGDPNGTWRRGDADPSGAFTHPGIASDNLCGDGTMQMNEDCEGSNLNGATCDSLGLGNGSLGCTDTCVFDTSGCGACGDGTVQTDNEDCDGDDLQGATCTDLGYTGGTLSCDGCRYDTAGCTGEANPDPGPGPGDSDEEPAATCGDGKIEGNELCDGAALGDATCAGFGYEGGTIRCNLVCTYDTSGCTGQSTLDQPEQDLPGSSSKSPAAGDELGDVEEIHMSGRACSTTPHGGAPTNLLILLVAGLLACGTLRRARSR